MSQQSRLFREQFHAMETPLLIQRYRSGGMVPDADAALLSVLEARGYTREALEQEKQIQAPAITALLPGKPARTPLIPLSDPRLRRLTITLRYLIVPVVALFVLLAIPLVGNFVVIGGATFLGCGTGENEVHSCQFLSWDIGNFVYGYVVDIFLLGSFNPFLSAIAFTAFVRSAMGIVWLLLVAGVYGARAIRRRQLTLKQGNAAK